MKPDSDVGLSNFRIISGAPSAPHTSLLHYSIARDRSGAFDCPMPYDSLPRVLGLIQHLSISILLFYLLKLSCPITQLLHVCQDKLPAGRVGEKSQGETPS